MPDLLEQLTHDTIERLLKELPIEKRLELLKGLSPEELMKGLSKEQLAGLQRLRLDNPKAE